MMTSCAFPFRAFEPAHRSNLLIHECLLQARHHDDSLLEASQVWTCENEQCREKEIFNVIQFRLCVCVFFSTHIISVRRSFCEVIHE